MKKTLQLFLIAFVALSLNSGCVSKPCKKCAEKKEGAGKAGKKGEGKEKDEDKDEQENPLEKKLEDKVLQRDNKEPVITDLDNGNGNGVAPPLPDAALDPNANPLANATPDPDRNKQTDSPQTPGNTGELGPTPPQTQPSQGSLNPAPPVRRLQALLESATTHADSLDAAEGPRQRRSAEDSPQ